MIVVTDSGKDIDNVLPDEPFGDRVDREGDVVNGPSAPRPRRPWWRKALIALGILVAFVLALAGVAYGFGSMMPPSAETEAAYEALRANGAAPEIERQFHVPIPGCVCHSDNPVITMQHSNRRIRDCMECHGQ